MENLKGRVVQINSGGTTRLGEVIGDRGTNRLRFGSRRSVVLMILRSSTSPSGDCSRVSTTSAMFPSAMGVYLIAKPIIEECA